MTASIVNQQPQIRQLTRDSEGHRTYKATWLVETTTAQDGPSVVMNTPGLALIGSTWNFGNDLDVWAFAWPDMEVSRHKGDNQFWTVVQTFSTKPLVRCQDESIEDPLLEPDRISGSFVKYTEEAVTDRNGDLIKSSSHEQLRGPQVEFDANRPNVRIEQNVSNLELATFTSMVDTVNDSTLWGLGPRKIKLSNVSWERRLFGTCSFYYIRKFDFDVKFDTFDRDLLDEGTKALNGDWDEDTGAWVVEEVAPGVAADATNPQHFIRYKDRNGENARAILDGSGVPISDVANAGTITVERYAESNFLTLGIPTSLT